MVLLQVAPHRYRTAIGKLVRDQFGKPGHTVTPDELGLSEAPLALIYERATGNQPMLISVISLFAVVNGALIQIIMAARVCYGLSRQGWLPALLGRVHPKTRTPVFATLLIAALTLGMALWLPIETLAGATSYLILVVFALVNLALWRIKRRTTEPPGAFLVPLWIPILGFISCALFIVYRSLTIMQS